MRELTLLDTEYLAGLLLLSLVLPVRLSVAAARLLAVPRGCKRTVGLVQAFLSVAGAMVLVSSVAAPVAALFGALSCLAGAVVLQRQLRTVAVPRSSV